MSARDIFILAFTFFVGIFSGWYFYVTSFKPIYDPDDDIPRRQDVAFDIIAVSYGFSAQPDYIYPSFRVYDTGSYDYFPGGTTETASRRGTLPKTLVSELREQISETDLDQLMIAAPGTACVSYEGGVDYEYNIEQNGIEFTLDTCTTVFSHTTPLGTVLLKTWQYLDDPNTTSYSFSFGNSSLADEDIPPVFPLIDSLLEPFRFFGIQFEDRE